MKKSHAGKTECNQRDTLLNDDDGDPDYNGKLLVITSFCSACLLNSKVYDSSWKIMQMGQWPNKAKYNGSFPGCVWPYLTVTTSEVKIQVQCFKKTDGTLVPPVIFVRII